MDLGVCVLMTEDSASLQCKQCAGKGLHILSKDTLYKKQQMWWEGGDIYVGFDSLSHTILALQIRGLAYFWFILYIKLIKCKKISLNAIAISCMQTNKQQQQQKDKIGNSFSIWQPWNCREN